MRAEWRVLWRRDDGKWGHIEAASEDEARSIARPLHESPLFTVAIESREVGPWWRKCQAEFPDPIVVGP